MFTIVFRSTGPIGSEFCVTIAVVAPASEITCKAFSNTILQSIAGPLFSGERADDDQASGIVYVLRSKFDLPFVVENRDVLHKIGITGGSVEKRIANASHEASFLFADVEVVATVAKCPRTHSAIRRCWLPHGCRENWIARSILLTLLRTQSDQRLAPTLLPTLG